MANPYKEKVLAFNKRRAESDNKASDMDIVIRVLGELPPGQLKKVLSDEELLEVLRKYGIDV